MTDLSEQQRASAIGNGELFYTYIWRDADGVPFYVGKGMRRRAWNITNRSKAFRDVHDLGGCTVEVLEYFATASEAHSHEVALISLYGRRDLKTGNLVNMTDGGDGFQGVMLSEDAKSRISRANKGNNYALGSVRSDETRARISISKKGQRSRLGAVLGQKSRDRISASLRGRSLSEDHKKKVSEFQLGRPKPADHVAKVAASLHMCPPRSESTSGFKGVSKQRTRWVARINSGGERRNIAFCATPEEAARAYDRAAVEAWGLGNCYLNFPEEHQ